MNNKYFVYIIAQFELNNYKKEVNSVLPLETVLPFTEILIPMS